MSRRNTGPTKDVVELVLERDGYTCVRCGHPITGERGVGWSLQHRIPRGMGGSKDERLNLPANLIVLDGSGTTGCHGDVESNRAAARAFGYLVWRSLDPAEVPVTVTLRPGNEVTPALVARFLLDDDGYRTEYLEVPDAA